MWQELGIAATADTSAIRRAYAARLKLTRPDQDPVGFARLRAAYETALAFAERQASAEVTVSDAAPLPQPPEPSEVETVTPAPALHPDEVLVVTALQRFDVAGAAAALEAALRRGALPIGTEMRLSAYLVELLTRLQGIPLPLLLQTAVRFGWHGQDAPAADPAVLQLQRRIAAELWFADLQRQSRSLSLYIGMPRAGAAKLLLGSGGFIISRLLPPQPPLLELMSELHAHGGWLRSRFNAARIARVETLLGRIVARSVEGQGYLSATRWRRIFSMRNARFSVLALLPGIAAGAIGHAFLPGFLMFQCTRAGLSWLPTWQRPFAIFGTIASICAIVLAIQVDSGDGFVTYNDLSGFGIDSMRWSGLPSLSETLLPTVEGGAAQMSRRPSVIYPALLSAARRGDSNAMLAIGDLLLGQAQTTPEIKRAAAWLTASADRGNVTAMLHLDSIYLNPNDMDFDAALAYKWSGIALRLWRGPQDKAPVKRDHDQAGAALFPEFRRPVIKEIRDWQPHASPLPE